MKTTMIWRYVAKGTLIGVVGLSISLPAWANKFYKWVDEQGTTHYSAQPPRAQASKEVNININTPSGGNAQSGSATSTTTPNANEPATDIDRAAEIERQNREAIAKNCEIMRTNLQTLNQHSRIRSMETGGETRMLGEEERQERIKKAEEYIKTNCQ